MQDSQHTRQGRKQQSTPVTSKIKRQINWWMWAFIVLLGLIIGSGITIAHRIGSPVQTTTSMVSPSVEGSDDTVMSIKLTKRQLNRVIGNYLNNYLKQGDVHYSLTVGTHAVLKGTFKFFGSKVGFGMQCDPYVQSNGNVILKATKMNVGALSVPVSYVLSYVGNNYKLPKMVSVNSKDKTIVLRLNQFDLGNGLHVRADRIDLVHDKINLSGYLSK
ncbi:YpmS family protein [Lacticaseibacillus zhaodongensis]|uniref:YpmS family protein n=1 Tax=Lacticaseibacillus zhaodongensis TaxID=2668065 RepID=UPI0012D2EE4F|nr:YpmS family protein [Lacticaseibacillus zhaodongensis]